MSIATLTTLAAVRDAGAPTQGDMGKAAPAETDRAPAGIAGLLVTAVPTELVAPYTLVMAGIVGAVAPATRDVLRPDQLEGWRWVAFGILMLGTVLLVWVGAARKHATRKVPLLEILAAAAAAATWALALPDSPLTPYLDAGERRFVPLLVGFAGVALTAVFAAALRGPSRRAPVVERPR